MRILLAVAVIAALAGAAGAEGFADRNLSLSAAAGRGPEVLFQDWGREHAPPPGAEDPYADEPGGDGPPSPADPKGTFAAPGFRLGAMVPFLSKEADYAAGFALGASLEIGLAAKNALWARPSLDLGFLSAEETDWEADSALLLIHLDAGLDWVHTRELRVSTFLALGAGIEFFSATGTAGAQEDFSETNGNALAGGGLSLGFRATPELAIEAVARLSFPLGSRNVRGLALVGAAVSYRF